MSSYGDNTYIVFLELPEDISHKIDMIRGKFSNTNFPYKAHITLKQDEDFLIDAERFADIIAAQLRETEPIQLEINQVSGRPSDNGWNIYLPVKSRAIPYLVRKMSRAVEAYIDPKSPKAMQSTVWEQSKDFYAHISIKGLNNQGLFEDCLAKLKNEDFKIGFPIELVCNRLTIARWHDGQWKAIRTIKLGSK
jgi:hypothetical protein